jgi:hypothetical protein
MRVRARRNSRASHGFELRTHRSAVRNFRDREEVSAVYPDEVADAIRQFTGADRVATMSWMVRTSGELDPDEHREVGYKHSGGVQPRCEAHCDSSPDRIDAMAQRLYQDRFPGAAPFQRFLYSSFWRAFSPPPQDYPLALCDGNSVRDDEGVPNTLFVVDQIPARKKCCGQCPMKTRRSRPRSFITTPVTAGGISRT